MGSARPLYQAREYAEVADPLGAVITAAPHDPMLFFNLTCCESLAGRTSDAFDHLRHAIEMSDEFRDTARGDSDLDPIRDEPAFKQLIRENGRSRLTMMHCVGAISTWASGARPSAEMLSFIGSTA